MDKKRTAIYVRVSSTKLSQKDSPEHQLGVCKERAKQEDLYVCEEHIYRDSDTGTNIIDRRSIQLLMKDAKKGLFDIVMFASLSRFARDTHDAIGLKRILVDALGIRLISLDEGYDSEVDKDELKFTIISAVNQKLSEQISYSSRRGKKQSGLKGNFTGSIAPFGYKKVIVEGSGSTKKTLKPDPDTMYIVKKIFQLYTANKLGEKEIVKYLNNENIKSPKGKVWGISSVQRILQNEAYIGKNVFSKYETKKKYTDLNDLAQRKYIQVQKEKSEWLDSGITHPPIIDEDTFLLAQELRLERGGGKRGGIRNRVNVFAGMIKCKHCGSSMVSMKSKNGKNMKDGREYRYLICSKRRRQGDAGCVNNFWLPYYTFRDDLLEQISSRLRSVTSAEELLERHKDSITVNTKDTQAEVKDLQKKIETNRKCLFELRKQKMSGDLADNDQYEFEKSLYEQEIHTFEKRLNILKEEQQKKDDLTLLYEDVKETLDELLDLDYDNFDETQLTLKKLLTNIEVSKDGNINVVTTFGIPLSELENSEINI